mmetsp:Transcript_20285/g.25783  ORF Transcript_20285/g.25783 Transcript_20285/m.25783 type:complete len:208 (-) Transcript_20285:128-751(-)
MTNTDSSHPSIHADIFLTVQIFAEQVLGNLLLPFVTIGKELLLIIQKFLVRLSCKLKVWAFNNCVNWACLLTVSAVNALGHVNIITGCPTRSIFSLFSIDRNSLCRARSLAELACNATLITRWVAAQCVLTTETRTQVTLFKGIVDGNLGLHGDLSGEPKGAPDFSEEENLGRPFDYVTPGSFYNIVLWRKTHLPLATNGTNGTTIG